MEPLRFKNLLHRYLNNNLPAEELQDFIRQLKSPQNQEILRETIGEEFANPAHRGLSDRQRSGMLFQKIMEQASEIPEEPADPPAAMSTNTVLISREKSFFLPRMAAAAAVLLLILGGIYYAMVIHKPKYVPSLVRAIDKPLPLTNDDVNPGGNKALLTLGDGTRVYLGDSVGGLIARQGNSNVLQEGRGVLSYRLADHESSPPVYNTVSTQRGGQFMVLLPDGSRVWLNAASSLRFPTAFSGSMRSVTLTGEGYFEIAPDKSMPFRVLSGNQQLDVLGTHFNIMAYEDEGHIKTTLLEGAVKLTCGADRVLLRPGQQARLIAGTETLGVSEADTEEAIAWKNGFFQFHRDDIGTIMRQLGRWYDVEVSYAGHVPGGHFSGAIGRQTRLSQVLHMLEVNDIHFRIEGKKIIVL
jgi:transmembrane sensor